MFIIAVNGVSLGKKLSCIATSEEKRDREIKNKVRNLALSCECSVIFAQYSRLLFEAKNDYYFVF